ncbi:hypothetical protein ONA02_05455 [Mycoplasmopsis felis]|uniref:hypothetical protein n=1 Tax=Mycoplasmopsis felis TaxID=33923 RepID=UPI0022865623|nr:hypothetical protein [Mycoplasmopsis felis]WAM02036.1 hypothetical protein ONA02_05455 [Mycoplasmopsis felis]
MNFWFWFNYKIQKYFIITKTFEYYLEFVDENDNVVSEVELGNLDFIAENGKTGTQASVKIYKNKNQDTNNKYKSIINIDYQFNISG